MRVFKIHVEGLGHRYIPAATRAAAVEEMKRDLLRAMPVTVEDTEPDVALMWQRATQRGLRSQRRLLQSLDGITGLMDTRRVSRARAAALRDLAQAEAMERYAQESMASAAPLSGHAVRTIQDIVIQRMQDKYGKWL